MIIILILGCKWKILILINLLTEKTKGIFSDVLINRY